MNIDKVKVAYENNRSVKAICDEMASRDRNQNETKLERILKILWDSGSEDVKRSDVIGGFRALEEANCGRYVEGRHGWPSRFVWAVKSRDVAGAAKGQKPLENETAEKAYGELEMIEHTFVLRPDLPISFELPDDLTEGEAVRLATFMRALPFGPAGGAES